MLSLSLYEAMKLENGIAKTAFWVFILTALTVFEILVPRYHTYCIRRQVKRIIKKGKLPYSKSSQMDFYDEFFIETDDSSKTEQKYSSIEKISFSEESKTLYLHIDKLRAYIIPGTSFDSPENMVEFIKFIKTKCSSAHVLF